VRPVISRVDPLVVFSGCPPVHFLMWTSMPFILCCVLLFIQYALPIMQLLDLFAPLPQILLGQSIIYFLFFFFHNVFFFLLLLSPRTNLHCGIFPHSTCYPSPPKRKAVALFYALLVWSPKHPPPISLALFPVMFRGGRSPKIFLTSLHPTAAPPRHSLLLLSVVNLLSPMDRSLAPVLQGGPLLANLFAFYKVFLSSFPRCPFFFFSFNPFFSAPPAEHWFYSIQDELLDFSKSLEVFNLAVSYG